ncbi:MAG: PEP/pyruvate-binding domain-containing protein, partial [Gemmatimonadota bacterium]
DLLADIRVPRTWYIVSDAVYSFIRYNSLEEVYDQKYLDLEEIRQQYPHIVRAYKNSRFPAELRKGLSAALDDLGDRPLIVRSSSLLEDRTGAAFSGKYRSLFLANRGSHEERLRALQDAVAEVYASIFSPDAIEYRAERNLLDVHEEMGIMIQEVVGRRVGRYFMPAYSGVAFSNNEFRWSPRIKREDGLVRLVPGLGTRAVDRTSDDYPVLLTPGQPGLRANATVEEVVRYAPKQMDVIDLDANAFVTVPVDVVLRECGNEFPVLRDIVSILDDGRLRRPTGLGVDPEHDDLIVTFQGLSEATPFMSRMATLLQTLRTHLGWPVDIEFACDGDHLYLLQCRSQSRADEARPADIPRGLPPERVLFTAHRFVSNGRVPTITHVVYVDPERYAELADPQDMQDVGHAVSRLNKTLPRRRFILMGPGRWGSRGDIRLGVSVTYSGINNTAMLIEIARRTGQYVPDLSFGTHFFQDLVEGDIRYLPLYPDEPGSVLNEAFFREAHNLLPELVPEYAQLDHVIRAIDVREATGGDVVRVLLNGDSDEAIAFLEPT